MQYFTHEWWSADCPNAPEVFARYAAHFSAIRGSLPEDVVALEENHTLHDSEVKDVACDFEKSEVVLALDGWDRNLENRVRYTLCFLGVSSFRQRLPERQYLKEELGDLGYWECHIRSGVVEMSMLFVSGAEFTIRFTGFELQWRRSEA
jgi:hypothetical protein